MINDYLVIPIEDSINAIKKAVVVSVKSTYRC